MSKKSPKIAVLVERHLGHPADAHYLGYFECFNRQLFFEAHEVLEELWLKDRHGLSGDFHKGLIQLAGAFVHVQKKRPGPAAALFRLAERNLARFAPEHEHLDLREVLDLIRSWLARVEAGDIDGIELTGRTAPRIAPSNAAFKSG